MALDNDKQNDILLAIQRLQDQFSRFMSDRESEKENLKRTNADRDARIRALEDFENNLKGERSVLKVIIGILCSVVVGLIIYNITKR